MSQLKARLTVVLKADDVIVAEAENALLWQRVLKAINSGNTDLFEDAAKPTSPPVTDFPQPPAESPQTEVNSDIAKSAVGKFSLQLGLQSNVVIGACDPNTTEPYLQLDMHNWSAVKTQLPERGLSALSPVVVAATLLGLWFRAANLGNPTQAQAQKVLATINVQDKNPSRGIKSAPWLQARPGGQVLINAAQVEKAILLAKCFCSKDWKPWKSVES